VSDDDSLSFDSPFPSQDQAQDTHYDIDVRKSELSARYSKYHLIGGLALGATLLAATHTADITDCFTDMTNIVMNQFQDATSTYMSTLTDLASQTITNAATGASTIASQAGTYLCSGATSAARSVASQLGGLTAHDKALLGVGGVGGYMMKACRGPSLHSKPGHVLRLHLRLGSSH
jgi:hypothetical protein